MTEPPEVQSPAHPPAHRVALHLLLAVGVGGPVAMFGLGAVLTASRSGRADAGEVALVTLALGVVCAAMEVGAEVVRRLGPGRAFVLLVPGALATVLGAAAVLVWCWALAHGNDPLAAAEKVVDELGKLLVSRRQTATVLDSALVRLVSLLVAPLAAVALLRARRAPARRLLPLTALAALLAGVEPLWWEGPLRLVDLAELSWPVWAALGLLLVDRVEPRVVAALRRAWLAARGEPPDEA